MSYVRSTRFPELFLPGAGAIWWAFLPNPDGGRQLRESTGHRDEKAAHGWYLERVRKASSSKSKKDRTLAEALTARVEWLTTAREHDDPTRKRLASSTILFYENHGRPLVRLLGEHTPLSSINHETVRRYIVARSKEVKATTVEKDLITLSCAMRLARKDGIECAHFSDIVPDDFRALYVPRERWLSEEEVDALLRVLPPERAAVVAFIVATGATYPSEVAPVRKAHINGSDVHLHGTKRATRNRKLRVPSYAKRFLERAVKSLGPWGFAEWKSPGKDLKRAARLLSMCEECRIRQGKGARNDLKTECPDCKLVPVFAPLSPNDLRRTFAQWLVRSGVPYELAYPMMGHSSPKMLETVYGRRDSAAVADLVELALARAPKGARKTG
jgi:integrase